MDASQRTPGRLTYTNDGLGRLGHVIDRLQELAVELRVSTVHIQRSARSSLPVLTDIASNSAAGVDSDRQLMSEMCGELYRLSAESMHWRNEFIRLSNEVQADRVRTLTKQRELREGACLNDDGDNAGVAETRDLQSTRVDARKIASLRQVYFEVWSVATRMFQSGALTTRELDAVRCKRDRPLEAAETLIDVIESQPYEVYECFLDALKQSNQTHVYERFLNDGWQADDRTASSHSTTIRTQYGYLLETLDTMHSMLLEHLIGSNVIELFERDEIKAEKTPMRQNEKLLSVLRYKSPEQFELFLDALDETGQRHVRNKITGREEKDAELPRNARRETGEQFDAARATRFGSCLQEQLRLQTKLKLKDQEIDRLMAIIRQLEQKTTGAEERSLEELEKKLQEKEMEIRGLHENLKQLPTRQRLEEKLLAEGNAKAHGGDLEWSWTLNSENRTSVSNHQPRLHTDFHIHPTVEQQVEWLPQLWSPDQRSHVVVMQTVSCPNSRCTTDLKTSCARRLNSCNEPSSAYPPQ